MLALKFERDNGDNIVQKYFFKQSNAGHSVQTDFD